MRDRNLSIFRSECKRFPVIYALRKRTRERLRETQYYLSKPDQIHSHMFSFSTNDSGHYLNTLAKKYQCEDMLKEIDLWMNEIDRIIDGVPAVSMKYFIWVIWLEQKNYHKIAEKYNENPDWLSRTISKQLQESFRKTGINVAEMDIFTKLLNRQIYYDK